MKYFKISMKFFNIHRASLLTGPHDTTSRTLDEVATSTSELDATAVAGPRRVPPWPRQGRLYNISNFGDTNACYADVDAGDERLFFLTVFDNRLSAKYDDLFGAVADRTIDNEDEILKTLGRFSPPHLFFTSSLFGFLE